MVSRRTPHLTLIHDYAHVFFLHRLDEPWTCSAGWICSAFPSHELFWHGLRSYFYPFLRRPEPDVWQWGFFFPHLGPCFVFFSFYTI